MHQSYAVNTSVLLTRLASGTVLELQNHNMIGSFSKNSCRLGYIMSIAFVKDVLFWLSWAFFGLIRLMVRYNPLLYIARLLCDCLYDTFVKPVVAIGCLSGRLFQRTV